MERIHGILLFLSILILGVVVGHLSFSFWESRSEVTQGNAVAVAEPERNRDIVAFLRLFVAKVLKAKGEVSFDDRLKLENAVRELNDSVIFAAWQKFVDSKQSDEAQQNLKDLIEIVVNKI